MSLLMDSKNIQEFKGIFCLSNNLSFAVNPESHQVTCMSHNECQLTLCHCYLDDYLLKGCTLI